MKRKITVFVITILLALLCLGIFYCFIYSKFVIDKYVYNLDNGIRVDGALFWDKNDDTLYKKVVFLSGKNIKKQIDITYYTKGGKVNINGDNYIRQRINFKRSKINAPKSHLKGIHNIYSRDRKIYYTDTDKNNDGVIDRKSYIDNLLDYKIVLDVDYDGTFDTWEYYKNGRVYKTQKDTDGDGIPDETKEY